jgi:sugar lactone lactonase YvrE
MPETRLAKSLGFPTSDELRFLPEGPIPTGEGTFSWVGIQHGVGVNVGSLNLFNMATGVNESFNLPGRPGFAMACQTPGKFVVGCERQLGFFDVTTGQWSPFCEGVDADVDNTIINDGIVFGDNLIFGTKDLAFETQKAGLYLFRGRDQKLIRLRDDQICSNGKAIITDADGSHHLIDIDSPTRLIVRYRIDIDAGTLGKPQTVLDLTADPAVPDGMILTPDGNGLIVSMFNPWGEPQGETRLYDFHSGALVCTWVTAGAPQNTCPALVRYDGSLKLVITTAVENMSAETKAKVPASGYLFVGDTDLPDFPITDPGGDLSPRYPA